MFKSLPLIVGVLFVLSTGGVRAENPSPQSLEAARNLVATLKLGDQYRALLPGILFNLRPTLAQDRPEIERDFDAMVPTVLDTYGTYYNGMLDSAAALYASNFSVDELHAIDAFYRSPAGHAYMEKSQELAHLSQRIGEEASRRAAENIKTRMSQLLREKGHRF